MRYELPQFINIEDKIFGPFTFKQFVYLAGGGAAAYVLWELLPTIFAIILTIPIVGLALALAFYKVNGRPFIHVMQAAFSHAIGNKFYLWKQKRPSSDIDTQNISDPAQEITQPANDSRLREISWSLDVLDMDDPNANRDRKDI